MRINLIFETNYIATLYYRYKQEKFTVTYKESKNTSHQPYQQSKNIGC